MTDNNAKNGNGQTQYDPNGPCPPGVDPAQWAEYQKQYKDWLAAQQKQVKPAAAQAGDAKSDDKATDETAAEGADDIFPAEDSIDLDALKTKSGKTLADFQVPDAIKQTDKRLIDLVMRSESMNDGERQYWFNLTEIMSPEQVEKLRDILVRERKKLAEIEAKYGKPKVQLSPEEIAKRNADMEQKKAEQQARLEAKEKEYQQEEADKVAAILAELEGM
jgi:hypothetical protein